MIIASNMEQTGKIAYRDDFTLSLLLPVPTE
jgi:hypothetical protein